MFTDTASARAAAAKVRSPASLGRSRVTNGNLFMGKVDGRSRAGRRFRDVLYQLCRDLNARFADLSVERAALVRTCATLIVAREMLEYDLAVGERIDPEVYAKLAMQQRMAFKALGLAGPRDGRSALSLEELGDRDAAG